MKDAKSDPVVFSRREFLCTGAALGLAWSLKLPAMALPQGSSFEAFMTLSRQATGFDDLDSQLGLRYFQALSSWEPELARLLSKPFDLQRLSQIQAQAIDLVVEAWYTGVVPTAEGSRVVSYAGALGHRCLSRSSPVTACRS